MPDENNFVLDDTVVDKLMDVSFLSATMGFRCTKTVNKKNPNGPPMLEFKANDKVFYEASIEKLDLIQELLLLVYSKNEDVFDALVRRFDNASPKKTTEVEDDVTNTCDLTKVCERMNCTVNVNHYTGDPEHTFLIPWDHEADLSFKRVDLPLVTALLKAIYAKNRQHFIKVPTVDT